VKAKIKKGDTVEVISGRYDDKGRRGEVIKVMPKKRASYCTGREYA
jgi:large subunit ribosomal protein L24